jgi:hypothetical protein
MATLSACDSSLFNNSEKPSPLELNYPTEPIAPEGGSISMTIKASGRWTVSKTTSWLTVEPNAGVGEQTITIAAPSNMVHQKDTPNRKTRIYIIAGQFTETIDIVQAGYAQPTSPAPTIQEHVAPCEVTITIQEPVEHAVAYRWYCDSVEVLTDTSLTFEVMEGGTHSYAVAGVNITGNVGAWSDAREITMEMCPPPQQVTNPITGADANDCSVATGKNTVTLTAPKIPYASTYMWYLDGALIDSTKGPTFVAKRSGAYSVKGVNAEGESGLSPAKSVTITPCPLVMEDLIGVWQASGYYSRNGYNLISHRASITKQGSTQIRIQDFLRIKDLWASGINDYTADVEITSNDTITVSIAAATKAGDAIYSGTTGGSTVIVGYGVSSSTCGNRERAVVGKLVRGDNELILDFSIRNGTNTTNIEGEDLYPCLLLLGITADDGCVGGGYTTYGLKFTR